MYCNYIFCVLLTNVVYSARVPIVCTFGLHKQILVLLYGKIGCRSKGDTAMCGYLTSKINTDGKKHTGV